MPKLKKVPVSLRNAIQAYLLANTGVDGLKRSVTSATALLRSMPALNGEGMAEELEQRLAAFVGATPQMREKLSTDVRAFMTEQGIVVGDKITITHPSLVIKDIDARADWEPRTTSLVVNGFRVTDTRNVETPPLSVEGFRINPETGKVTKSEVSCFYKDGYVAEPFVFEKPAKAKPTATAKPAKLPKA